MLETIDFSCIDQELHEHIYILNRKGYITKYCCSSHLEEYRKYQFSDLYLYIEDYVDIGTAYPESFQKDKNHNILRYRYTKKLTDAQFTATKRQQLQLLLDWCKHLPECTKDIYGNPRAIAL